MHHLHKDLFTKSLNIIIKSLMSFFLYQGALYNSNAIESNNSIDVGDGSGFLEKELGLG